MKRTISLMILASLTAGMAFGRGENWVPKPPAPPPVETLTNADRDVEWKFRTDVPDPKTGLGADALKERVVKMALELEPKEDWAVVKAKCYAYVSDNMSIDVSPYDWYPAISIWNRYNRPLSPVAWSRDSRISRKHYPEILGPMDAGNNTGRWMVWKDFDHIVPEWEKILALGFPGMKKRLRDNWQETPHYRACEIVADAALRMIDRFVSLGESRLKSRVSRPSEPFDRLLQQIASLKRLRAGEPKTAYDAMMFIYLYFICSEHLDIIQCRSLSIIDRTLWPYYRDDLAAGRTTEAEFRDQFKHFLWQWGSIDNYWGQPVTIGGTKADGTTEYNPLSMIILDVMDQCALPTPKFHAKIAKSTPEPVLRKLLDMARRHRSLSFIGEEPTWRVLMHCGATLEEARGFYTKGCYEFCIPNAGNGLGGGHMNLVKQVEYLLAAAAAGKFEAATFEAFVEAYLRNARRDLGKVRDFFFVFEKHLDDVNPANIPSLAVEYSVKTGKDALATGSERGNSTGICLSGFGTAVDALMAVKEIVYENEECKMKNEECKKRHCSLNELGEIMAKNWEGHEDLRLRMLRSKRKWGTNDAEANALARRIAKMASDEINGKPNSRGGKFRLSGHNARQFVCEGRLTGATPDGRKKGEEFSKNLSPTMGADTEGVTALVQTLGTLDSIDFPGDFPLDVMLLPYTVAGEKGLDMMKALLDSYYANNGLMMQFNVFDPEELRDAQKHPEKYENLQVRVCGWNVRWNDLPKVEQDAYIRRAEAIAR